MVKQAFGDCCVRCVPLIGFNLCCLLILCCKSDLRFGPRKCFPLTPLLPLLSLHPLLVCCSADHSEEKRMKKVDGLIINNYAIYCRAMCRLIV